MSFKAEGCYPSSDMIPMLTFEETRHEFIDCILKSVVESATHNTNTCRFTGTCDRLSKPFKKHIMNVYSMYKTNGNYTLVTGFAIFS